MFVITEFHCIPRYVSLKTDFPFQPVKQPIGARDDGLHRALAAAADVGRSDLCGRPNVGRRSPRRARANRIRKRTRTKS